MLTLKGIAPRWTGGGDRSEGLLLGEKQRSGKLEQRGRRAVELRSSACLVVARRARGGLFIGKERQWSAVEAGRRARRPLMALTLVVASRSGGAIRSGGTGDVCRIKNTD